MHTKFSQFFFYLHVTEGAQLKNRSAMHTWELMSSFIPFGWSLLNNWQEWISRDIYLSLYNNSLAISLKLQGFTRCSRSYRTAHDLGRKMILYHKWSPNCTGNDLRTGNDRILYRKWSQTGNSLVASTYKQTQNWRMKTQEFKTQTTLNIWIWFQKVNCILNQSQ